VLVRNFLQILGLEAVAFHTHKYSYGDWQDGSLEMPVNTMVAVRTEPVVS
jgi:hypothetical protein